MDALKDNHENNINNDSKVDISEETTNSKVI